MFRRVSIKSYFMDGFTIKQVGFFLFVHLGLYKIHKIILAYFFVAKIHILNFLNY